VWLGGNLSTKADWFTRSDILRRIKDSSRIIANRYNVRVGRTPEEILNGDEGWCNHHKRLIWVNPLAVYKAGVFGLRTQGMSLTEERQVVAAILRGVLGLSPDLDVLRQVLGEQVIPRKFQSDIYLHVMAAQSRIREWMRQYNGLSPREEWVATQYIAFHERLHERFTYTETRRNRNLLGTLWNMLEDERIERLGSGRWLRVAWFIKHGNEVLWRVIRSRLYEAVRGENPVKAISNFPVFARLGFRVEELESYEIAKRELRPEFHDALDECWPHMLWAWNECRNSDEVYEEAKAIVEILKRRFPQQSEEKMVEGSMDCPIPDLSERGAGGAGGDEDQDEKGGGGAGEDDDEDQGEKSGGGAGDDKDLKDASPGLGDEEMDPGTEDIDRRAVPPEPPKMGAVPDSDMSAIVSSDYHEILSDPKIAEGVARLRRAFDIPDPREQQTKSRDRRRGRLNAKAYRKTDGEQPFITRVHQRDPGRLYVELLGDWSGSMAGAKGAQEPPVRFLRRAAVMVNAALMGHKRVLFNCRVMPHNIHVATNHEGEEGLMRCAGIQASSGTEYTPTFEAAYTACKKQACSSLIILIADGQFNNTGDKEKTRAIREKCERNNIEVRVLYVASRENVGKLVSAFGEDNVLLLGDAREIPDHIEAMVSSMGAKQYRKVYV